MLNNIEIQKKKVFFLLLTFLSVNLFAQEQYKFSTDIEKEINNDKSGNESYRYQMGAMNYSISNYYFSQDRYE